MEQKNKKYDELDKIEEHIEYIVEIECKECKNTHVSEDDIFAAEEFYDKGWRVIDKKCLCPSCVSKIK